jgi:structure-specific recognition protein 1
MEIRFHVPSVPDSDVDPAQELVQNVLSKADIQSASDADAICTLTELNCQTPRGRYDVKFFTDFIDLHGKTFDYKISYDHILRLFLLPHKDQRQMYFVVSIVYFYRYVNHFLILKENIAFFLKPHHLKHISFKKRLLWIHL